MVGVGLIVWVWTMIGREVTLGVGVTVGAGPGRGALGLAVAYLGIEVGRGRRGRYITAAHGPSLEISREIWPRGLTFGGTWTIVGHIG
jgi:hypothetical protein